MKSFKFSKPKGPGFGVSRNYYLSVLSARAVLPPLLEVIEPEGRNGAIAGLGAPLMPGATKEMLSQPLVRGAYALATRDRKTVLKMLVLSKEEAGFDPEPIARSRMAADLSPEALARIRATWMIAQLTFESHDPAVHPALRFHLEIARRLATLSDGVVADPISQRYLLPEQVLRATEGTVTNVLDLVSIASATRPDGMHAYTLGLQKVALPELEIVGLDPTLLPVASRFLLSAAQEVLKGTVLASGSQVGPFEAREGGLDRALWEGIPALELLPPTKMTATDALELWARG